MFRKHVFIEDDSRIFLYIPATNKLLVTNQIIKDILKSKDSNELVFKIEQYGMDKSSILSELHKLNLFREDIINISEVNNNDEDCRPSSIVLSVVQKCNLNCRYCFAEGGEYKDSGIMTFEIAQKAIDQFQCNDTGKPQYIVFFGGEPLLNFGLIKRIVDYCEKREKEGKSKILFSITTNATLITDEVAEYFSAHNIHPHISIDGDKKTNDANRFNSAGKGSYNSIVEGLNKLHNKEHASARGTLTNAGADVNEAVQHLLKLGFGYVFMAPAFNLLDSEHLSIILESYRKLYDAFRGLIIEKRYEECRKIQNIYKLLKLINSAQVRNKFCGAGINEVAIDINGDVYPCHRFIGQKEFIMGNIDNTYKKNMGVEFKKRLNKKEDLCEDCIAKGICGGGCYNENYLVKGSINTPIPSNCTIMKYVTECALNLYITLTSEDKEKLFEKA